MTYIISDTIRIRELEDEVDELHSRLEQMRESTNYVAELEADRAFFRERDLEQCRTIAKLRQHIELLEEDIRCYQADL